MNLSTERLPRCCEHHPDWGTLGDHLCSDFPAVLPGQVVRDLHEARSVTEAFGLNEAEALDIGELIVRYRLMLLTGAVPDGARLDPQIHIGRMTTETAVALGFTRDAAVS